MRHPEVIVGAWLLHIYVRCFDKSSLLGSSKRLSTSLNCRIDCISATHGARMHNIAFNKLSNKCPTPLKVYICLTSRWKRSISISRYCYSPDVTILQFQNKSTLILSYLENYSLENYNKNSESLFRKNNLLIYFANLKLLYFHFFFNFSK